MLPRGLSQNALARALNVPPRRINEIVLEKRAITANTALRLARREKARVIERDVEPLVALQSAMA
jgi:addiction module HigA family antidote